MVDYLLSLQPAAKPPVDLMGVTPTDLARAAGHANLADKLQQHYRRNGTAGDDRRAPQRRLHNGDEPNPLDRRFVGGSDGKSSTLPAPPAPGGP